MNKASKNRRLRTQREFTRVLQDGKKFVCPQLVVLMNTSQDEYSRLGIIVSKRVGNAAVRNHIKRRLREIFRQLPPQQRLGPTNVVFIARKTASFTSFQDLHSAVLLSFQQLERKLVLNREDLVIDSIHHTPTKANHTRIQAVGFTTHRT